MMLMLGMTRLVPVLAVALVALVLVGCTKPQTQSAAHRKDRAELEQYWAATTPVVAELAQKLYSYANVHGVFGPGLSPAERAQQIQDMKVLIATMPGVPPAGLTTAHGQLLRALHRSLDLVVRRVDSGRPVRRQLAVMRTAVAHWAAQVRRRAGQVGLQLRAPSFVLPLPAASPGWLIPI